MLRLSFEKHKLHYYFNVWSSRLMTLKLSVLRWPTNLHQNKTQYGKNCWSVFWEALCCTCIQCLSAAEEEISGHTRATKIMKIHSKSPSHFKAHRQSMQLMLRSYILRSHQWFGVSLSIKLSLVSFVSKLKLTSFKRSVERPPERPPEMKNNRLSMSPHLSGCWPKRLICSQSPLRPLKYKMAAGL